MTAKTSEEERIVRLAAIFATRDPSVLTGIGDDAAVLAASAEPLVWTVDAAVEGTHFRRGWLTFEDIGYRSTMAAVSDLAAMGADPLGVLSSLVLSDDVTDAELEALARGQREATAQLGTAVIGGNLARGRELSITTTALGRAACPILRSGAVAGEALWLAGPVGLAAAGLRLLLAGRAPSGEAARACLAAWRRPLARIDSGRQMRGIATAAVDVSDGLVRDVGHLARASNLRAVIDVPALENEAVSAVAAELGVPAEELLLFGGEDYALVMAAPPGAQIPGAIRIGRLEPVTSPDDRAVIALAADGSHVPYSSSGYDHFAR